MRRHPIITALEDGQGYRADFGEMVFGRPEIRGCFSQPGTIRVEYIESLDSGWASTINSQAMYADMVTGEGSFVWKSFQRRPCRYIELKGDLAALDSLTLFEYNYPLCLSGSFSCSDERLNHLFRIAERTLRICTDEIFYDCPHRDQAQWMDAFVSAKCALHLYGITDLTRKCLLQHGLCSFVDGHMLSPSIHGGSFLPDYTMIQLVFLLWYYRISGDRQLLEELYDNSVRSFDCYREFEANDGLLDDVIRRHHVYLDNTFELCRMGKSAGLNALYYAGHRAMAEICRIVGKREQAAIFEEKADHLEKSFHRVFAHESVPGCFRDSDRRLEHFFYNINFSCELGKWTGAGAVAELAVISDRACEVNMLCGTYGRMKIECNGETVFEVTRPAGWQPPAPMYAPCSVALRMKSGENRLRFFVECNDINWDLFFDLPFSRCEIFEATYPDGEPVGEKKAILPRPWYPPFLSQSTNAYACFAGLMQEPAAIVQVLAPEYPRNYISVRVPLFSRETSDRQRLANWILPVNTPWTAYYLLTDLFACGQGKQALDFIRLAWGVMLDRDARNTFEEFNTHSSLCHAWGASPTFFFLHDVLGIQYEKLYERRIIIRPNLCGLSCAEGASALSADGSQAIRIRLQEAVEGTEIHIEAPDGYILERDFSRLVNPIEV